MKNCYIDVPSMRLLLDLGPLLVEPLKERPCAPAMLSALLLKVEEMMYYDRPAALRVFDRYSTELLEAIGMNHLSLSLLLFFVELVPSGIPIPIILRDK